MGCPLDPLMRIGSGTAIDFHLELHGIADLSSMLCLLRDWFPEMSPEWKLPLLMCFA